jgi:hypothetical protein
MRVAPTDTWVPGGHHRAMTQARSHIVAIGKPGFYHCFARLPTLKAKDIESLLRMNSKPATAA